MVHLIFHTWRAFSPAGSVMRYRPPQAEGALRRRDLQGPALALDLVTHIKYY